MQRRFVTSVPVLAVLFLLCGCQQPHRATIDRLIIGEVMMNNEFAENLRALCLPGGRLSGTPNGHQAERFVAEKLREYGLSNVHLELFEMPGWQVNETTVTALTEPPLVLEDPVALRNVQSTPPEGITAELVDAGQGTPEDFDALDDALDGKFALIHLKKRTSRRDQMQLARDHGAVGVLYAGPPERLPIIGNCHPQPRPEPGVAIRHEDGEKLAEQLSAGQTVRLNVKVQADFWDATANNVVGEIPGNGPLAHEVVLLGAHLDSWHLAEGAIDNANGSATILETARALAALDWKPRRTVRFVWFMGEEQDLFGSKAYVAAHTDELDDIVAVINADMPGSPRKFVTFGHPEIEAFLRSIAEQLRGYEIASDVTHGEWGGSDHAPFMEAGVCAVALWGDLGDGVINFHTINDKYDVVDRRATIQSAAVLGVLVRQLADCPARPGARVEPGQSPTAID